MTDLRSRLERIGERIRVAPDAFERLERARRRHERNRKIAAGTVALLVAIAGSLVAFSAFRGSDGQVAGASGRAGGQGFFALWPESTLETALATQDEVASGSSELGWRLDPEATAVRFTSEALGWPTDSGSLSTSLTKSSDGSAMVDLTLGAIPGDCQRPECGERNVAVRLRQLVADGGIWSVVSVESPVFNMPLHAGDEVAIGSDLSIASGWPDGTEVAVGVAGTGSCSAFHEETVTVQDLAIDATIQGIPPGCTGYVYALTPSTPNGQVELGRIVFPTGGLNLKPDLAYSVESITALPVLFSSDSAADVAEFTCDGTGTIAPTEVAVEAQRDGVHVAVTNTGAAPVSFSVASLEAPRYVLGDGGAEPGEYKETVWQLPPGEASVSCGLVSHGGADRSPTADLYVEDPTGSYVPANMGCPRASQGSDHAADPARIQGGPVEIARQKLSGLEFDDRVEGVGYPESSSPVVGVIRDGNVVALATFTSNGQGGWLIESLDVCVNVPIAWSDEVAGVSGPMGPPSPPNAWDALCSSARADGPNSAHNGADLHVEGRDIEFDTRCLIAPAGEPITIRFSNGDAGIHRNISIYPLTPYLRECLVTGTWPTDKVEHVLFRGEIISGVDEIVYQVGRMEPGEFYFQDDIHVSANGVLVIE